jgi:hypothetical protein
LFGDDNEIVAITSNEEHAYNAQTELWYLPQRGNPKLLLSTESVIQKLSGSGEGSRPGVTLGQETYDGFNAGTKGRVFEFWAWDSMAKALIRDPK